MNTQVFTRLLGVFLVVSALATPCSHAVFGIFSRDKDRLPTKKEVAMHDKQAAKLFAAGEKAAAAGKGGKALNCYRTISRKYYFSRYSSEALFRTGELLYASGESQEAFKYYQQLIDRHHDSPRYQRAVEQQFNIAIENMQGKHGSMLGVVPKKTSREKVIGMFNSVIRNAPASIYAAQGHYYIGEIHRGRKNYDQAVASYQKVVDDFPKSDRAPKAQLRIAEIHKSTAHRPDNPTNLQQTREAYEDFITNFPQHANTGEAYAQLSVVSEAEARKSLKIGKYYQEQGNTKGAAIYFKDALRCDNSVIKQEARNALTAIAQTDPEAMRLADINSADTQTPVAERLKNQKGYLGPPAPDLVASNTRDPKPKPNTPLVPSKVVPRPLPSDDVLPPVPVGDPIFPDADVDVDSIVPTPPPTTADDVLGGNTSLGEPDIDSLLPPVPPADE